MKLSLRDAKLELAALFTKYVNESDLPTPTARFHAIEMVARHVLADADYYRAALGMEPLKDNPVPEVMPVSKRIALLRARISDAGDRHDWDECDRLDAEFEALMPDVTGHCLVDAPAGYDTSRSVLEQRLAGASLSTSEGEE